MENSPLPPPPPSSSPRPAATSWCRDRDAMNIEDDIALLSHFQFSAGLAFPRCLRIGGEMSAGLPGPGAGRRNGAVYGLPATFDGRSDCRLAPLQPCPQGDRAAD
jgi:hypothetical protein